MVPWPAITLDVVERRDQGVALQLGESAALAVGLIEAVAKQHDVAALTAHRVDLDVRRGLGHHDDRLDAELGGRQGDPWAWLPAEAAMTPRSFCSWVRVAILW